MSKALRALERVRWNLNNRGTVTSLDLDIIEEELKRLEDYDKTEYSALIESHKKLIKEKKANEKYFKAVDFLLENGLVDIGYDEEEGSYYMTLNCGKMLISDEEYKLWKEILCS